MANYKFNLTSQNKTLNTAGKYLENNIALTVQSGSCTVAGGGLSKGTASGGGLSGGGLSATTTSITPTVEISLSDQTTSGVTITDTKPTSGYYLTLDVSNSGGSSKITRAAVSRAAFSQTVSRAAITDTHTAGWIPAQSATTKIAAASETVSLAAGSLAEVSTTVTVNAGAKTHFAAIPAGSLSNSATKVDNYTELTAPVIPAEGYLVINAGWYPNSQISLGTLIPDDTNYSNAGVGHILSGYEAYDTTGKKLIGTIATQSWSDTYYTTTNTGYGAIPGNVYSGSSAHYIKNGSVTSVSGGVSSAALSATNATLSTTNNSGIAITTTPSASAITYTNTAGWIPAHSGTQIKAASTGTAVTQYVNHLVVPGGKTLGHYTSASDYEDGILIGTATDSSSASLYVGLSPLGNLYVRDYNGGDSYVKVGSAGQIIKTSLSTSGITTTTSDTSGVKAYTGTGWISATNKYISGINIASGKTLTRVVVNGTLTALQITNSSGKISNVLNSGTINIIQSYSADSIGIVNISGSAAQTVNVGSESTPVGSSTTKPTVNYYYSNSDNSSYTTSGKWTISTGSSGELIFTCA